MAASETEICNSALVKVGAQRILSLSDTSKQALICREQYPKIRDALLASHPWNFAISRVALAVTVNTPVFDWTYEYQLPTNCLRVLSIDSLGEDEYAIEGDKLYCDLDEVKIRYIKKETDVAKFSAHFCEALACALAADICYALTQSSSKTDSLETKADKAVRLARSFDAQEGFSNNRVYADSWLNTRS